MLTRCVPLFVIVLWCGGALAGADESRATRVYSNDFAREAGPEWSNRAIDKTLKGQRPFLGMFGGETVTFRQDDLPPHRCLRLSCSLYLLNPWDGSSPVWGPDPFDISIDKGPTLLHATFGNCGFFTDNNAQSFPDEFPDAVHPVWTGADEKQTLGYMYSWGGPDRTHDTSSIYHLSFTFPHTAASVALLFTSFSKEEKKGEAWGLANFQLESLDRGSRLDDKALTSCWNELASDDPLTAFRAKWTLVESADSSRKFLALKLRGTPVDQQRVRDLAEALGSEQFVPREAAQRELLGMGSGIAPLLRAALKESASAEAQTRLRQVLEKVAPSGRANPERLQRLRAAHALEIAESQPNPARREALKLPPDEASPDN